MLKDILTTKLNIVFCGSAKGKASVKHGHYYAGPGNRFYGILYQAGFTPHRLLPSECYNINQYSIGLTDLVHTECGNDNEINPESYEVAGFIKKMEHYKPRLIAFTSKKSASFALGYRGVTSLIDYGMQMATIGSSKVFVLPSPSGNARKYWNETYWHQLFEHIKETKY